MDDIKLLLKKNGDSGAREAGKERLCSAIVDYIGQSSEVNAVTMIVEKLISYNSGFVERQKAASALNSIMLNSTRWHINLNDPAESKARYRIAMAVQELSRDLTAEIINRGIEKYGDAIANAVGARANLTDVVKSELETVKLIHLGDTEHRDNSMAQRWLSHFETLENLAKLGVKHVFIERSRIHQGIADSLSSAEMSRDEFIVKMKMENVINPVRDDVDQELSEIADLIVNSSRLGIRVHFSDPWEATIFNNEITQNLGVLSNDKLPSNERKRAGEMVIDAYVSDAGEGIREFAEHRVDVMLTSGTSHKDKILEGFVFDKRLFDLRTQYDGELASLVHNVLKTEGGCGILFYGSAHGSHNNGQDFNDQLQVLGTLSSKINLYIDERSRHADFAHFFHPEETDRPQKYFVFGSEISLDIGTVYEDSDLAKKIASLIDLRERPFSPSNS